MIYFIKPEGYSLQHGQYMFANIPKISCTQWHPFTAASAPGSRFIVLMIKRAGDFTGQLIDTLFEQKKKAMRIDELNLTNYSSREVFNLLHDIYGELRVKDVMEVNKEFYLHANMSLPIYSPSQTFMDRSNVVLIGAGSGIAPYLPLLEEIIRFDIGKPHNYNFNSATLVFIAREGEQISWISNYLFHLLSSNFVNSFLNIRIYVTLKKNSETVPSFLFWRALMMIYKKHVNIRLERENEDNKDESSLNMHNGRKISPHPEGDRLNTLQFEDSPVSIKFGRPNFFKIFRYLASKGEKLYHVYLCGPEILHNHMYSIVHQVKKETNVTFKLSVEQFS